MSHTVRYNDQPTASERIRAARRKVAREKVARAKREAERAERIGREREYNDFARMMRENRSAS